MTDLEYCRKMKVDWHKENGKLILQIADCKEPEQLKGLKSEKAHAESQILAWNCAIANELQQQIDLKLIN